jgi:hypothetical protein
MRFMEADSKLSASITIHKEPLLPTSKKVGDDSLRPENISITDDEFSVWQVGTLRVVSGPVHTLRGQMTKLIELGQRARTHHE